MTVRSIYVLEVITKSFKSELSNPYQPNYNYSTRNKTQLPVPTHKTSQFKTSFSYMSHFLYKKVPKAWKDLGSLEQFRSRAKQYLLSAELYSFQDFSPA